LTGLTNCSPSRPFEQKFSACGTGEQPLIGLFQGIYTFIHLRRSLEGAYQLALRIYYGAIDLDLFTAVVAEQGGGRGAVI